jgi:hypothetical protein
MEGDCNTEKEKLYDEGEKDEAKNSTCEEMAAPICARVRDCGRGQARKVLWHFYL